MGEKVQISINQLADFFVGSEAAKMRIINQQKVPNPFRIAYYQLAKSRIRKALQENGDLNPVIEGIEELKRRKPTKKRQVSDRVVSIEALQRFLAIKLPKLLINTDYEIIKPKKKSIFINDVEIIVSPDVIIKGEADGHTFYGGFKIHISKSNVFNREQQSIVACSVYKYLIDEVAGKGEIVLPELCISLDVFGNGIVTTTSNLESALESIHLICEEIKQYWNVA